MISGEAIVQQVADLKAWTAADLTYRLHERGGNFQSLLAALAAEAPAWKSRLGRICADALHVAYVDLETTIVQPHLIQRFPKEFARKHTVMPLYELNGVVTCAAAEPGDPDVTDSAAQLLGQQASFVYAFPAEISDAIEIAYQSREQLYSLIQKAGVASLGHTGDTITAEQLIELSGQDYIIEFARGILLLALMERASDIHIEPSETHVRIRFRIDGIMQERFVMERATLSPLITRLKVQAGMDIAESRRPQDGRIRVQLERRQVDLRLSTIPTVAGEKMVLRLLGQMQGKSVPDMSELGFSATVRKAIDRVITSPNGVFFVTGPTGSGKTTTLYSILSKLNSSDVNIVTVEDPVEYRLEGVYQVQVNPAADLDFAAALRAFLRQDPDVILIGEIRDVASAKIAAQAALTGHLVLATMHTNNSLQAVTRLTEIGVEPFLVAPSIIAVMAQRLVRRICPNCKVSYPAPRERLDELFDWDGQTEVMFYRGTGCDQCFGTGFRGRVGVHEVFMINQEVRSLIARNASILDIQDAAARAGFQPLVYDGLKKVLRGLTTIEEIDAIAYSEGD